MKQASHFKVSPTWKLLLSDMQIESATVLAYAKLPADLFNRENATITTLEYFQFWCGLEKVAGEREIPLLLANSLSVEAFEAPIFAALCSADLNTALAKIKQYKLLIGPVNMTITTNQQHTSLVLTCYGHNGNMPQCLELSELVFFTQLARIATRTHVSPLRVIVSQLPKNVKAYEDYFGCKIEQGTSAEIYFCSEEATRPFLTSNAAMWNYFEEGLNKNLANLAANSSMKEKVRAILVELLPAGISSVDVVADKLALSKRTLQRKLAQESESYNAVLQDVRTDLANHYLSRSKLSNGEIAFLLGYQEANSFIRAFTMWNGATPSMYRELQH